MIGREDHSVIRSGSRLGPWAHAQGITVSVTHTLLVTRAHHARTHTPHPLTGSEARSFAQALALSASHMVTE